MTKIPSKEIYRKKWFMTSFKTEQHVKTVEQVYALNKEHELCQLFSPEAIRRHRREGHNFIHIGLVQVAIKPLTRRVLKASVMLGLRDARFIDWKDSLLGLIEATMHDGPVYFDYYLDFIISHNLDNLDYIQQYLDGTVKISFDRRFETNPKPNLLIEELPRSSSSRQEAPRSSSSRLEVPRSRSSRLPKDKIPARHSFAGSTTTEELKRRDLELERELRNLKLKGVHTSSQVSHPCYTADSQLEDEESQGGNASPMESDFIVETTVDPQLCTLRKPFKTDWNGLNEDIESEANLERRRVYRERFKLEQKKEILSHFKKHISQMKQRFSISILLMSFTLLKTRYKPSPRKIG